MMNQDKIAYCAIRNTSEEHILHVSDAMAKKKLIACRNSLENTTNGICLGKYEFARIEIRSIEIRIKFHFRENYILVACSYETRSA